VQLCTADVKASLRLVPTNNFPSVDATGAGHGCRKTSCQKNCLRRHGWRLVVRGTGVSEAQRSSNARSSTSLRSKVVTGFHL